MPYLALTLADLELGLAHLFDAHSKALGETNTGKTYGKLLRAAHDELRALPRPADPGRPFAEELAAADAEHDGYGTALWYLLEAHRAAPSTSPSERKELTALRDALVPSLLSLRAPYADEAAAARGRREAVEAHRARLRALPVTKRATLEDWALGYVEAAEKLGALLVARAQQTPAPRTQAGRLRSRVLGLLSRFRDGLADELSDDADRAAGYDRAFFAYFDQLEAQRAQPAAREAPSEPVAPVDDSSERDAGGDHKPAKPPAA